MSCYVIVLSQSFGCQIPARLICCVSKQSILCVSFSQITSKIFQLNHSLVEMMMHNDMICQQLVLITQSEPSLQCRQQKNKTWYNLMMMMPSRNYIVYAINKTLCQFSVSMSFCCFFADSCSLSRITDWCRVFVACIDVIFCLPLDFVAVFCAIFSACLAEVSSDSPKICPLNLSLF